MPRTVLLVVLSCFTAAGVAIWVVPSSGHRDPILAAVAFSPDGRFLMAGEREGGLTIWQVPSWQKAAQIRGRESGLNTLAFSPDSHFAAIAGRSIQLWRTQDWQPARTLGRSGTVYGTARFNSDGRLLASVNDSERIELWNAATGELVRRLCCMALYGDLSFSPDDQLVAAAGHWPRLWDVATGRELRRLVKTRNPTFAAVSFRPDGQVLATGSQDGKAELWDVATGLKLASGRPRQNYIETVAFHPSGRILAYGARDGAVWLWDTATGVEQQVAISTTTNVAFSADGRWLAFGGTGSTVHVWSVNDSREAFSLRFEN